MMLLTCTTHLMSVTLVRNYWQYPWLAALRVVCVTGVFVFTGCLMINQNAAKATQFPTKIPAANETSSFMFMPAACFQSDQSPFIDTMYNITDSAMDFFERSLIDSTPGNAIQGWNWYILILIFYVAAIVAELIRHIRWVRERPGWRSSVAGKCSLMFSQHPRIRKLFSYVFLAYLNGGIGISAAATIKGSSYIFSLRQWVDKSEWIQTENDMNPENDATGFGQLVPIFMCVMVVFGIFQMISGENLAVHLLTVSRLNFVLRYRKSGRAQ